MKTFVVYFLDGEIQELLAESFQFDAADKRVSFLVGGKTVAVFFTDSISGFADEEYLADDGSGEGESSGEFED